MLLLLTQMVFFGDICTFLQLSCIGQFGTNRAYLQIKRRDARSISLKRNSILKGKELLDAEASNIDAFLLRDICVCSTQLIVQFRKNRAYHNLKNKSFRKYSFQKLPEISRGGPVLDPPDYYMDGFLWRDTGVFQIISICIFGTNRAYLYCEKPSCSTYSFKNCQLSQGNDVLDAPASSTNGFISRDI
jgi:hypothetical protein